MISHKASSVSAEGRPDGFEPPTLYRVEAAPDGTTRLKISASAAALPAIHQALVEVMGGPFGVLYIQLTDRRAGRHLAESPNRLLAMEISADRLREALQSCAELIYRDGRSQLWVRGPLGEQLILDEMGLLYAYPDDPLFRDALAAAGVEERAGQTLDERDYVRVELLSDADAAEDRLSELLQLQPWR